MLVVRAILKRSSIVSNFFKGIISRILILLKGFEDSRIYHILRKNNRLADQWAKHGTNLGEGVLEVNGISEYCFIP